MVLTGRDIGHRDAAVNSADHSGQRAEEEENAALPLGSMEPRAGEDLGRNVVPPPAFRK